MWRGSICAACRGCGGNTRLGAWSLFSQLPTCGGDHIWIQQTGLAVVSWSSRHTLSDLGCLFSSRRLSLAGLDQPRNHDTALSRNCQSFAVCVAVQALAVLRVLAPAVVTLAKTRPFAAHRRKSLDTSSLRLQYHTFPQHRPCTLHQSHSLGSCRTRKPDKLVMPGKAWTEIDKSRHAEAKADTTSGVGRNGAWHHQTTCPPSRGGISHVRVPRIMVETPGAPVVENIQPGPCSVLHCTDTMWMSSRQCQPCRQCRRCTPQSVSFLRTSPVTVCCTHLLFEGCVESILRWTRQFVFSRRCHVQSHP